MNTEASLAGERYFGIDIMKIAAAFMITFYHFQRIDYGFTAGQFYFPNLNRLLMNLCVVSVPLFFMCNGAILLNNKYSVKQIFQKTAKIILLILVWHWLSFPDWFFKTLCLLYCGYPILRYSFEKKRWIMYLLLVALLAVPFMLNLVTTLLKLQPEPVVVSLRSYSLNLTEIGNTGMFTIYGLMYFLLGGILMKRRLPIWLSFGLISLGFALCTLEGIIYTNYYNTIYDGVNSSFPTLGALFMSVGVFDLMIRCNMPTKYTWISDGVIFASKHVLGIYLFHLALILQVKQYMTGGVYPVVLIAFVCFLIDAACILICAIIRKIPYVRGLVTI